MSADRSLNDQGATLPEDEDENALLDVDEAEEVIPEDGDVPMEDDEDGVEEEIQLQNDSVAHFDSHSDSIFCIARHPTIHELIATGGGDDVAYIFNSTPPEKPLLPSSYESNPRPKGERRGIEALQKLNGHTDSVNAISFTLPNGDYVLTAGLDGKLRAWKSQESPKSSGWLFMAETQEVQEINWLAPCPHPSHPNTVALGANDGSVWIYEVDESSSSPLTIVQVYSLHTGPSTAGCWTSDGSLLATVSEDSSFYVYDPFGDAAARGISPARSGSQSLVGLTADDQRFEVEGGLYSVAISPGGTLAAVGGAGGHIRMIGLPRISAAQNSSATTGIKGAGSKSKPKGARQTGGPANATAGGASAGQAGQILASLQAQSDSVESLSFSQPPVTLLAAGNVDGSIALFDVAHRFAVRRHIREAHDGEPIVKVDFGTEGEEGKWQLISCGFDGVVRRWDTRSGTTSAGQSEVKEWKGHRGGGEGGGVLGFVVSSDRIVTAGDDGISLVFDTT